MATRILPVVHVMAVVTAFALMGCDEGTPKVEAESVEITASCSNTGNARDTFSLNGATITEGLNGNAQVTDLPSLCDPLIDAYLSTDFFVTVWKGMSGTSAAVTIQEAFEIQTLAAPSTYDLATTDAFFDYLTAGGIDCTADGGSITIAYGGNLMPATGSFNVTSWIDIGGFGCPGGAFSGSFDILRNDSNPF